MTRAKQTFTVFGFASTHDALDAEQLLGDLGIDAVPIPAPATAGTLCGIALRLDPSDAERADAYLEAAGVTPAARLQIEDF